MVKTPETASGRRPKRLTDEQKIFFELTLHKTLTPGEVAEDPTRVWSVWAYRVKIGGATGLYGNPAYLTPDNAKANISLFEEGLRMLSCASGFCDDTTLDSLMQKDKEIAERGVTGDEAIKEIIRKAIADAANPEMVEPALKVLAAAYRRNPNVNGPFKPYHPGDDNGSLVTREHRIALREVLRQYERLV